jgi:hypothetical protein
MPNEPSPQSTLRRRGRRAGIVLFSLIITAFTVVCSVQVLQQVWAPQGVPTSAPCRTALRGLFTAVERARAAASQETRGERASVRRFRDALEPEWLSRPALDTQCESDPSMAEGLQLVDWLRYAEEHAARYEATDLADLRRRGTQLMNSIPPGK